MYDIIVIGAGPAGLTAALYALRAEKRVLIIEKETFGGQITYSPKIENYPGFTQLSGNELADKMLEQVLAQGAELELDRVTNISDDGNEKIVSTENGSFKCRAVIIATGAKHRHLGIDNEEKFIGEGISFCAVCDGAFYRNKTVAVIGGGNSALQDAVLLSDLCKKVYVIQNLAFMTGEKRLVSLLEGKDNVSFIFNSTVQKIIGEKTLDSIVIRNSESGQETTVDIDGIFVAIGQAPENDCFKDTVTLDDRGYILSDESCTTCDPAVFVAGDCRTKNVRQIATATSDGAIAALAAIRYLDR